MGHHGRVLTQQRRDLIMAELRQLGAVGVTELAAKFGVSGVTIRRDITVLADQGLLERAHGGATLVRRTNPPAVPDGGQGRRRFSFGMVVPSIDFYWPHVVAAAQLAAAQRSCRLMMRASGYDPIEDRRLISRMLDGGAQGLLLAPTATGRAGVDLMRWIAGLKVPTVLLEREFPGELPAESMDSVCTDHRRGAALALRHLVREGHRRAGLFTTFTSPHSGAIRAGWRQSAGELGLDPDACPDASAPPFGAPGWQEAIDGFLADCLHLQATGILVHSDPEAVAILQRAEDRGIDVPAELAIIAYDDEIACLSNPAITAIRPPKAYLGGVAVEMLLARAAEGQARPVHRVQLLPELILRQSTRIQPDEPTPDSDQWRI
jgi:DNA-binding LacI/PurR family transcriptional regulator